MPRKYFTVEEANELLPFLDRELAALQALKEAFQRKYLELRQFRKLHYLQAESQAFLDHVFQLECELDFMQIEAQNRLRHIHTKGVQVKDIELGLVDFPAVLNGQEVLLCWRKGETRVAHYHGVDEGFAGRKELP